MHNPASEMILHDGMAHAKPRSGPGLPPENLVTRLLGKARRMLLPPDYYVAPTMESSDTNREASDREYLGEFSKLLGEQGLKGTDE